MKRSRITTIEALEMLLDVERTIGRIEGETAPSDGWRRARQQLFEVRSRMHNHVRAALTQGRVR